MNRSKQQNIALKNIIKDLDKMVGEECSGLLIAVLTDAIMKVVDGKDSTNLYKIEIICNDTISTVEEFDDIKPGQA